MVTQAEKLRQVSGQVFESQVDGLTPQERESVDNTIKDLKLVLAIVKNARYIVRKAG